LVKKHKTTSSLNKLGEKKMEQPAKPLEFAVFPTRSLLEPDGQENRLFIHPTAEVSPEAVIGAGCRIWNQAQIRERARLGKQCIIGKDVYIDRDVIIGDNVKIQNQAQLFRGVVVESGVFIGPCVCFTNDHYPRAINLNGKLKTDDDWSMEVTFVSYGASIGAGALILPGVKIGAFAMIGAGAIVTKDVAEHQLVIGQPAQLQGYVCRCGNRLRLNQHSVSWQCTSCRENYIFN
jgi:UDP-2-acetamido-3-amino-2,3-dideoxy-glucuronate N-acetyltransferase